MRPMPTAESAPSRVAVDVEHLVVVDRGALGRAVALDHDPRAGVGDDVLLDDAASATAVRSDDPGARAVVDAVACDPHVPGLRR